MGILATIRASLRRGVQGGEIRPAEHGDTIPVILSPGGGVHPRPGETTRDAEERLLAGDFDYCCPAGMLAEHAGRPCPDHGTEDR